jgi:hypothetical protein
LAVILSVSLLAALARLMTPATWNVVFGVAVLVLDIIGAWWLAENVLVSDEEANRFSSVGAPEKADLTAKRDRRQATFSLVVITMGFLGQASSYLVH